MKALVYKGPGKRSWEEKPKPTIQKPTDAIVRIDKTTICGTDLHILKGDVPAVTEGRILGHEGLGVVDEVGSGVSNFKKGDRVLISCITSCGKCAACKKGMYSHCADGGWILGHLIDGTQAEYVRIPHADNSLYPVPPGVDEEALVMLSDILPTGFEVGVLNGKVKPGDTVAIVGGGPVGLALALDLGWRGRPCTVIEQGNGVVDHPKIGIMQVRTMEFFRRWGIAERVRTAGFPDAKRLPLSGGIAQLLVGTRG